MAVDNLRGEIQGLLVQIVQLVSNLSGHFITAQWGQLVTVSLGHLKNMNAMCEPSLAAPVPTEIINTPLGDCLCLEHSFDFPLAVGSHRAVLAVHQEQIPKP